MKLRVKETFRDRYKKGVAYFPGEIIEIDDAARCETICSMGLAEDVAPESAPSEPAPSEPSEKPK